MPRLASQHPKYCRHRASGQAVVTLCGRDFYLGPHGSKASRAEYDRLVGEWLSNGRRLQAKLGADMLVSELVERYWDFAKEHYKTPTGNRGELDCTRYALREVKHLYGRTFVADFGPIALEALRDSMARERTWTSRGGVSCRKGPWSRGYINQQVKRVRRMFRWGVSKQIVPPDVIAALETLDGLREGKTAARETAAVMPVSVEVVDATRPHLSPVVRTMVDLQMLTAMRPGELCAMRFADVNTGGEVWEYRPHHHKTKHRGRGRVILLGRQCQALLDTFRDRPPEAHIFSPAEAEAARRDARTKARKTPPTYGNRPGSNVAAKPKRPAGKKYTVGSYRVAITRACERAFSMPPEIREPRSAKQKRAADLTPAAIAARAAARKEWRDAHVWHPNQLRHSRATWLRKHYGIESASVILGHSNLKITEVYAEQDLDAAREIMAEVG